MNKTEKEVRFINSPVEIRVNEGENESRTITGYAVVFEQESVDMGFVEIIRSGAITEDLIKQSDVCALWNHNCNWLLARSTNGEGTLKLELDEHGLKYTFTAPNTTIGNDVLELIKRGDIKGSSFAFTVSPEQGSEEWIDRGDGKYIRYINHIGGLYDVSPVVTPAYEGTSVSARSMESLENFKKELQEQRNKEAEKAEQERVDALNKKYSTMLTEIDLM